MQDTSDEYNIDNFITLLNFIADPAIIVDEKANFLLINNAFDAMPNGGTLTINSQQTARNWTVTFTDSGEGMSKETLSKLGNPLFTTKAKGMGFGIPICKL